MIGGIKRTYKFLVRVEGSQQHHPMENGDMTRSNTFEGLLAIQALWRLQKYMSKEQP